MRKLTDADLRFLLDFTVGRLEPALLRTLVDKNEAARRHGKTIVVDRLMEALKGHEVMAPDPVQPH